MVSSLTVVFRWYIFACIELLSSEKIYAKSLHLARLDLQLLYVL